MKVVSVVGARPQFIKAFPISRALRSRHRDVLVHTGQHYDDGLSSVFFEELDLPEPDYHLEVGSAPPGEQIGQIMVSLEPVIAAEQPDVVLTYGDTNSTLAAAVVGAMSDAPLAHVEAGLRSGNRTMPEEINRVLTDHASDLLFTPTRRAVSNLAAEGITAGVHHVGDVMVDALLWARDAATARSTILSELGLRADEFVLATVHRAENTDDPDRLRGIIDGLGRLDRPVILPAHPRTIDRLERYDLHEWAARRVRLIEPVGYLEFIQLLDNASCVVTDSGGVQKEAFVLETPCVTVREETEWPETVEAGGNVLVGANARRIRAAVSDASRAPRDATLFGTGDAAMAVVEILEAAVEQQVGLRPARQATLPLMAGELDRQQ